MVYAGKLGDEKFSMGVSGRLKDDNLVMFDEETDSLWSQITGEALYGKSKGKQLGMLPAIFVGLGTWKKMHPDTLVLDLATVRARSWYYTTKDLAKGKVSVRKGFRRQDMELGIGLRHGGETLCVLLPWLHKKKVVQVSVGGVPLVVVWDERESAALVYDRRHGGKTLDLRLDGRVLVAGKHRFDVLSGQPSGKPSGKSVAGNDAPLSRFPYVPTYRNAWRSYYRNGKILDR